MQTYVMSPLLSFLHTNKFVYLQIYLSSLLPAPPPPITYILNVERQPHPPLSLFSTFGTGMPPLLRRPPPLVHLSHGAQADDNPPLHSLSSTFGTGDDPLLHGTQGSGGPTLHTLLSTFGAGDGPRFAPPDSMMTPLLR